MILALHFDGNAKIQIVVLDLVEPVTLYRVKGDNVTALIPDKAYDLGVVPWLLLTWCR